MALKALTALAIVTLVGFGIWNLTRDETPDFSRNTTALEAADELFGSRPQAAPTRANERIEVAGDASAQAAPERLVRGRVVDLAGRPIEGARINTTTAPKPNAFRPVSRHLHMSGWATSAADGSFEREWPAEREWPWLQVIHEDYMAVAESVPSSADEVTVLTMAPLARTVLAVEVVDKTSGQPAPRFRLMASIELANAIDGPESSWTSFSEDHFEGPAEFEVEFAVDRPLRLQVEVPGLTRDSDRTEFRQVVHPIENGRTPVRFVLDLDAPERDAPQTVAFGRVVDDITGDPIAGAEITGLHETLNQRRVQSFEDGRFRIALAAQATGFQVHHPRYISQIAARDGVNETEVRLARRGSLRGVLVDGDGAPLPGVPLLFIHGDSAPRFDTMERDDDRARVTTDAEGRFAFLNLHPNRYHLFALRSPRDTDEKAIANESVDLEPGEDRELTFSIEPPDRVSVFGTVLAPEPLDYALAPVFLPYAAEGAWTPAQQSGDGYRAGGLERGRYLVLLAPVIDDHREGPFALLPNIEVAGFGEQRLDFRYPTGSLHGRVILEEPRDDLIVSAIPIVPPGFAGDLLASGKVAKLLGAPLETDGSFTLERLAPGAHRLELRAASGQAVLATQEVFIAGSTTLADWRP